MSLVTVPVGFIPLVDAAPIIAAQEMGFAASEGIALDLVKAASWSSIRDMLAFGHVDAAHFLSPMPVATALGVGGGSTPISAVSVLSVNGNVVGVSPALAARMAQQGYGFDFQDALAAGHALVAAMDGPLRFGVPFPFSMHRELLRYWLDASGVPPDGATIHTIPPPLMADAMARSEIDAFCVGEPWGSIAVELGVGHLVLPGYAIWKSAPEKVLAVRTEWAESEPSLLGRIMRSVWRAGRWLSEARNATLASEILARPRYLGIDAEIIDRALTGHLTINPQGDQRVCAEFVEFHSGAITFPWRSQAAWLGERIADRIGAEISPSRKAAQGVFRSDLYRQHMATTSAPMPSASSKLEGALAESTAVAANGGRLFLRADEFFDGRVFDPYEE